MNDIAENQVAQKNHEARKRRRRFGFVLLAVAIVLGVVVAVLVQYDVERWQSAVSIMAAGAFITFITSLIQILGSLGRVVRGEVGPGFHVHDGYPMDVNIDVDFGPVDVAPTDFGGDS